MRRLKWIPVVLCLLLGTLTGTTVLYGRAQPAPPPERFDTVGLDNCGGNLCLFQITPGITTWAEAKEALAEYITRDEGDHFHGQRGPAQIRVEQDFSGSYIRAVVVQASRGNQNSLSVRFSQIIAQYGMPCFVVNVDQRSNGLVLAYPGFTVQALGDPDRITLDSPIGAITLSERHDLTNGDSACGSAYGATPWRGFASLQFYQSLDRQSLDSYDYRYGSRYP